MKSRDVAVERVSKWIELACYFVAVSKIGTRKMLTWSWRGCVQRVLRRAERVRVPVSYTSRRLWNVGESIVGQGHHSCSRYDKRKVTCLGNMPSEMSWKLSEVRCWLESRRACWDSRWRNTLTTNENRRAHERAMKPIDEEKKWWVSARHLDPNFGDERWDATVLDEV